MARMCKIGARPLDAWTPDGAPGCASPPAARRPAATLRSAASARPLRELARCALACAIAALVSVPAPAAASAPPPRHAILALYAAGPREVLVPAAGDPHGAVHDALLRFLDRQPRLRAGLWSSAQGSFQRQQVLLDISQGTRQPTGLYADVDEDRDGELDNLRFDALARSFTNWAPFRRRAADVSTTLRPGLLGGSVPGGAAFVAARGAPLRAAIAAADEHGRVAAVSFGAPATLAARARSLARSRRLVVVSLPAGPTGRAQLAELARGRASSELLLVVQLPNTPPVGSFGEPPSRYLRQPALAVGEGLSGSPTSASTRRDGLVSSIDFAPTILEWIGVTAPDRMRGLRIESGATLGAARLDELRTRWTEVRGGRQAASVVAIVTLAGILFLLLGAWRGAGAAIRPVLRTGGLAVMWWPSVVLLAAAVEPASRTGEVFFIAGVSLALGALTTRLLAWDRAPLLPAAVCLAAYAADLALGSNLLVVSVLGPSVVSGSRFYGVSNELEPILPLVLLVGLAALTTGREITRRILVLYGLAGLGLLVVVGWGRMGADVGGVITIGAGVAVATLVMLPGATSARRLAVAALVPVAALVLLVAIDLALSGGSHLTRNLLRADDPGELWELVTRRYQLSWRILTSADKPAHFLAALLAVVFAWRNRARLYAALPHRSWAAALLGGLAAGVAGALTNDSGPVLFINAVIGLAALTAYVLGRPDAPGAGAGATPAKAAPAATG